MNWIVEVRKRCKWLRVGAAVSRADANEIMLRMMHMDPYRGSEFRIRSSAGTDLDELAEKLVKLVSVIDEQEAVALIAQSLRMAHSEGALEATREAHAAETMRFDAAMAKVIGGPQADVVKSLAQGGQ